MTGKNDAVKNSLLGDGGSQLEDGHYKILFLIRHAKSSWETDVPTDFERPLNERGKRDAPFMAERLKNKNFAIDAFVSSSAKRAKKTAELFCEIYKVSEKSIHYIPQLYHADYNTLYDVVTTMNNAFNHVAIFSHNPGITDFANLLVDEVHIDNMPTCSVFAVKVFTSNWANFKAAKKELLLFDYPKTV